MVYIKTYCVHSYFRCVHECVECVRFCLQADANVAKIKLTNQKEKSREKQRKGRLIYYFRTDESEIIFTGVNGPSNASNISYKKNMSRKKTSTYLRLQIIVKYRSIEILN